MLRVGDESKFRLRLGLPEGMAVSVVFAAVAVEASRETAASPASMRTALPAGMAGMSSS
jgi:hypothetical protein